MSTWAMVGLLDANSYFMNAMDVFHDHTMAILVAILTLVGYVLVMIMMGAFTSKLAMEHQTIELLWTVIPGVVLIFIALPSLKILYSVDASGLESVTLKVMGHQWYWSYEYSDVLAKEFDSYMEKSEGLTDYRLLDVDNRVVLPWHSNSRVLVSAADVIHSWTIPAAGVKADAVPGRLNQMMFGPHSSGVFYGQCSEICGANHSFMPIVVEVVDFGRFVKWLKAL